MTWGPWLWYKAWAAGTSTLSVIDYMGESLASFFGITTPRYYFELEEYRRREELNKRDRDQAKGWSELQDIQLRGEDAVNTAQPQPIPV